MDGIKMSLDLVIRENNKKYKDKIKSNRDALDNYLNKKLNSLDVNLVNENVAAAILKGKMSVTLFDVPFKKGFFKTIFKTNIGEIELAFSRLNFRAAIKEKLGGKNIWIELFREESEGYIANHARVKIKWD
eukprot:Pompholyxophrys_sp_v1_NODE_3_length_18401_cov_4.332280.p13 type:complete len:131 gc:universal NODE_3_length_18401_cov_4.332280:3068-2676(-)